MSSEKIRVAIVGGGIVGATLANLLLRHPDKIEFELFESARQFTEIGAGLGIWARAMNVFREAGIYEACSKIAVKPDPNDPAVAMKMRVSDQKPDGYEFGIWRFEGGPVFFHRATLLDTLVSNIPKMKVHFGKRLASYEQVSIDNGSPLNSREEVILHFTDGTSTRTDVLVGCDGIKSAVRRQMFTTYASDIGAPIDEYVEKFVEPTWSGSAAYRALIPVEELRKVSPNNSIFTGPQQYYGMDKHLIVFQPNPTQINMVAFISDPSKEGTHYPDEKATKDVSQEELLHSFEDFESDAQEMFKLMPKPSLWAINQLNKLPFYARGNVVLVGDAAHAMTPHLGIGAGMGIEDASVLAHFLTSQNITHPTIPLALKAYDIARVEKTSDVHRRARNQGKTYEFRTEGVGRDVVKIQKWIDGNVEPIVRWKVEDDIRNGLEWIDNEVKRKTGLGARL